MKTTIREAIVVEGKYDAIRLRSVVDATIIETDGFGIFRQPEKLTLLKKLAEAQGLIVLMDSDSAGFVIRDRISGAIARDRLIHAYIPQITGKERRKQAPSKEGLLGVEGIDGAIVLQSLLRAGATVVGQETVIRSQPFLSKVRLYEDGLYGGTNSAQLRCALLRELSLPLQLSANRMIQVLNVLLSEEQYKEILQRLQGSDPHDFGIGLAAPSGDL